MSAPPPYATAADSKPEQYPQFQQPSPQHPTQPYAPPPQQPWYPPPQPGQPPQQYQPQPTQYPQPPGAYYQAAPAATTVVVTPAMPMVGTTSMFPPDPMQTTCPNCQQTVLTQTAYELGALVWFLVIVLVLFGLCICAWIPCVIDACKDVIHTCPSCGAVVGRHNRLGGGYGGGYGRYGRGRQYVY